MKHGGGEAEVWLETAYYDETSSAPSQKPTAPVATGASKDAGCDASRAPTTTHGST
jgi:hypothetical protein